MTHHLLQRLTLPTPTFSEPLLYTRMQGDARVVEGGIVLGDGASASFDTSFGVFHAGRWRRLTTVDQLAVRVRASGTGTVDVVAVNGASERVVASASLPRGEGSPDHVLLAVPALGDRKSVV